MIAVWLRGRSSQASISAAHFALHFTAYGGFSRRAGSFRGGNRERLPQPGTSAAVGRASREDHSEIPGTAWTAIASRKTRASLLRSAAPRACAARFSSAARRSERARTWLPGAGALWRLRRGSRAGPRRFRRPVGTEARAESQPDV